MEEEGQENPAMIVGVLAEVRPATPLKYMSESLTFDYACVIIGLISLF
jgi:hypothetical protein